MEQGDVRIPGRESEWSNRRTSPRISAVLCVIGRFSAYLLLASMLLCAGCNEPQPSVNDTTPVRQVDRPAEAERADVEPVAALPAGGFSPGGITILPLTELTRPTDGQGQQLTVYVALVDAFGSQMKAPGTFRIELYDYVQRSADPKGQRIAIWPDIDLTGPAENHRYWRDFLRAYEFAVSTQIAADKTYVVEVTCLIPAGRRLSSRWTLRPGS